MQVGAVLALTASFFSVPEVTWEKLAEPPKDVAGRELPPGTDGAWVPTMRKPFDVLVEGLSVPLSGGAGN